MGDERSPTRPAWLPPARRQPRQPRNNRPECKIPADGGLMRNPTHQLCAELSPRGQPYSFLLEAFISGGGHATHCITRPAPYPTGRKIRSGQVGLLKGLRALPRIVPRVPGERQWLLRRRFLNHLGLYRPLEVVWGRWAAQRPPARLGGTALGARVTRPRSSLQPLLAGRLRVVDVRVRAVHRLVDAGSGGDVIEPALERVWPARREECRCSCRGSGGLGKRRDNRRSRRRLTDTRCLLACTSSRNCSGDAVAAGSAAEQLSSFSMVAADCAKCRRHPTVLPLVSVRSPEGSAAHTAMQNSSEGYSSNCPLQLVSAFAQ